MSRIPHNVEDKTDLQIQQNVTNWQSSTDPLAPLTEEQLDLVYQIGDVIKRNTIKESDENELEVKQENDLHEIDTNRAFIKWMVASENEVKYENLKDYQDYYQALCNQSSECGKLFNYVCLK